VAAVQADEEQPAEAGIPAAVGRAAVGRRALGAGCARPIEGRVIRGRGSERRTRGDHHDGRQNEQEHKPHEATTPRLTAGFPALPPARGGPRAVRSPDAAAFDDRGAGPTLVLLHGHPFDRTIGLPSSSRSAASSARGARPARLRRREDPMLMRGFADATIELLDELDVERAVVVG
jgi:hypothetical protein